ncbi:hypothetical protein [Bifidobacterium bifidum]|uniref:hypothetical protein n=1 Tax=Bifidobacterium bifidum TaxID=1681 RepID=UPI003CFFBB4B
MSSKNGDFARGIVDFGYFNPYFAFCSPSTARKWPSRSGFTAHPASASLTNRSTVDQCGPCLLGCITAHALQLGAGNLTGPDQFHHRKRRLRVKDESEHERRRGQRQRACGRRGDAGDSASAPYPAGALRAK